MTSAILAYLDPGSGSVILQALLGGLAAVAVTFKLWWKRLTGLFRRREKESASTETSSAPKEPA
jgi:hypothetical protein